MLIYTVNASLDGYTVDETGSFDWTAPEMAVLAFITELERPIGTYLYGRRMYETMGVWERDDVTAGMPPEYGEYAKVWRAAEKIVYSRTLESISSKRSRIERTFDVDAIRRMKAQAGHDMSIGGPTLAAAALAAGLVDEFRLFIVPIAVGGGTPVFPHGIRVNLQTLDERRFAGGTVYLRYRTRA